jgi:RNA polymerase sigma factor (sigma-70 family)
MFNPFRDDNPDEASDDSLLHQARGGDGDAIDRLLVRHQPWILNLSLRMLYRLPDAEDAAQDILLKVFEAWPSFRGDSAFRTWLYRIAVNHLLNVRRDRWRASDPVCSFEVAAVGLHQVPDGDLPDPRTVPVPVEILVEETKIHCSMGTLLCLDGRQRLAFILGEVFGVSDVVGGEILDVTPVNFRQILSRARRDLYEYLKGNCSLVTPGSACACARKTQAYIKGGFVDPQKLTFATGYVRRVREVADERMDEVSDAYMRVGADVYRGHPFYVSADQVARLREALAAVSMVRLKPGSTTACVPGERK